MNINIYQKYIFLYKTSPSYFKLFIAIQIGVCDANYFYFFCSLGLDFAPATAAAIFAWAFSISFTIKIG